MRWPRTTDVLKFHSPYFKSCLWLPSSLSEASSSVWLGNQMWCLVILLWVSTLLETFVIIEIGSSVDIWTKILSFQTIQKCYIFNLLINCLVSWPRLTQFHWNFFLCFKCNTQAHNIIEVFHWSVGSFAYCAQSAKFLRQLHYGNGNPQLSFRCIISSCCFALYWPLIAVLLLWPLRFFFSWTLCISLALWCYFSMCKPWLWNQTSIWLWGFAPGCITVIRPVVPLVPTLIQRNSLLSFFWTGYLHT